MKYDTTATATLLPVSPSDVLAELRMDDAPELTGQIQEHIKTATAQVENDSQRRFITQTAVLYLDEFPSGERVIEIREGPVQSVTSVAYTDSAGSSQTYASSNYFTDLVGMPARIQLKQGSNWPATETDKPNAVVVTYQAGYGDTPDDVPAEAKQAIIQKAAANYLGCGSGAEMHAKRYEQFMQMVRWSGYHKVC